MELAAIIGPVGEAISGIFGFFGKKQDASTAETNADALYLNSMIAAKQSRNNLIIGAVALLLIVSIVIVAIVLKPRK
jgi:hypothetical protein